MKGLEVSLSQVSDPLVLSQVEATPSVPILSQVGRGDLLTDLSQVEVFLLVHPFYVT